MNIGIFYQSGYKLTACYMALWQLRKHYPDIPIALFEDGSDILKPIADEFSCDYKKTEIHGFNSHLSGRPITDLKTNLSWLGRIYDSCNTSLKNVDYFIIYEDDVWCLRKIQKKPIFDLSGANGPLYNKKLANYLFNKFDTDEKERGHWSQYGTLESYQACGGTIVNKNRFMEAYNKLNDIDWVLISSLDNRAIEWSDASLSFIMQHAGFSCGRWSDWGPYDSKNKGNFLDKTGWSIPFDEQSGDFAFLHAYKHYYNYTGKEIDLAKAKVLCEENGFLVTYKS